MHEQRIVHCDIKPSNVVLLHGMYCLIDFDAAVALTDSAVRRRATEAFSSSTHLLKEETCADWDLVGLFWTVTFFYARASCGSGWRNSLWDVRSRYQWGVEMIFSPGSLFRRAGMISEVFTCPLHLMHPKEQMNVYCKL